MPDACPGVARAGAGPASVWRDGAVARLALLAVLGFTSFSLTLSALPTYAAQGGASVATAGAVTAALLAATVLVQGFVPALERRFGTVRVFAGGLIALGAPTPLCLLSDRVGWLMVVSAVRGCGFAVLTVLGAVLTARIAPPGRLGAVIGVYGLAVAVPNLAAVPVGAALALSGHFPVVAILAALPVLALPITRSLSRRVAPVPASGPRPRWSTVLGAAGPPSLVLLLVTLAGGALVTFLPLEWPHGALVPVALLLFGASGALSRWRVGALSDQFGGRTLLPASVAAGAAGMLGVAAGLGAGHGTGAGTLVLAGAACLGVGYGACQNLTQVAAFTRAGEVGTASASAVWNAAFDAGTAIGAYAVGAVAAVAGGMTWTFAGCAALLVLALPLSGMVAARRT